jgi:hypothetical protein
MQLTLLLVAATLAADPAEDLTSISPAPGEPAAATLFYSDLQKQAYAALDRRQTAYDALKTEGDIAAYQQRLKAAMIEQLGGLPEKTPLNPQVVGRIEADGYCVEKVIFESRPQHHVTANLYLPKGTAPFPIVLVSSGHSRTAKTAEYNQRLAIALVRQGIAAMCYDPIGQGERSQILDDDGRPRFTSTTQEHFLIGVGSILVGTNTARYRIWDAIRSIDYVASRPDLDATRIGFTGCSGGGTLTSYVMALDERVACAAPACYLTTFRRLVETIGPQDAEQNLFGQLGLGLDQPDYVLLRAPRPTLISASTSDFFDIQGTWDNYRQAKRVYARLGYPERVDLVEAEGNHGVQPANLRAIVQWMQRWLLGKDDAVTIAAIEPRREAELLCTEQGQVLRLPGERSAFDLNADIEKGLAGKRREFWDAASKSDTSKAEALARVGQLAGIRPSDQIREPKMVETGRADRDGYHIDKFVLHTDSAVPLPGLTYHPATPSAETYLYLHDGGKTADGAPGGPIEKLVQAGSVVVAVDLRGTGETAPGGATARPDAMLGQWKSFYLAYLLGQPLVGLHAEDTIAAARFVANYKTKTPRKVHLVAVGRTSIPALHAAALAPELFASVTLKDSVQAWSPIVGQSVPAGQLTSTVHGALAVYDLPDLMRVIGQAKIRSESPGQK